MLVKYDTNVSQRERRDVNVKTVQGIKMMTTGKQHHIKAKQ